MKTADVRAALERKRDGGELSAQTWEALVKGALAGDVDDAQMAALFMACVLRGMSTEETAALTLAMAASGERLQFRDAATVVDKHSSGGVADVATLIVVPLVAACGVRVAKLAGRALAHTGGTIDKLEAIDGFDVTLDGARFAAQLESIGCAIAGHSERIAPADRRFYALRDRTGTVPSVGLIAASIVSKKIAGGAGAFAFDVKTGSGALLHNPHAARELARALVDLSRRCGARAAAFVTDMNEPLGRYAGTGLEVAEACAFLRGEVRDARVMRVVTALAQWMVEAGGSNDAATTVQRALDRGTGYEKFEQLAGAQGAKSGALERLRVPTEAQTIRAAKDGHVQKLDMVALGTLARRLSERDALGGIRFDVRVGNRVARGDALLTLFSATADNIVKAQEAVQLSHEPVPPLPVVYEGPSIADERSISEMR